MSGVRGNGVNEQNECRRVGEGWRTEQVCGQDATAAFSSAGV